jgi:integrase
MSRRPNPVPTYRLHKPSGQAVVTIRTAGGIRKDVYLGAYDSPESRAEYSRVLQETVVAPTAQFVQPGLGTCPSGFTVNELLLAFWKHAELHYRHPDGTPTSEIHNLRQVVRVTRELYGLTPVREFGPLALKAIQRRWIDDGLARRVINGRVARVRHIFKWGMGEQLVAPEVYTGLTAVVGLRKGRTLAREPEPVGPVSEEHALAVLPFVRPPVRAMIRVQLLTGMRPGEIVRLRPTDIDKDGPLWVYRPSEHKNSHRGRSREIPIGPLAQAILEPLTPADPDSYFFSPRRSDGVGDSVRAGRRKKSSRPTPKPRKPGLRYSTASFALAVARGCDRAGVSRWSPNMLRHAHGTTVRRRYGLEAAQAVLGHAKAATTEIYAASNLALAAKVAAEIG